ncbi:MAG: M23 family metallopeptidase [Clostridia bacterium]|nr:M23 family metallopeptidase [Clostridia bacterium]
MYETNRTQVGELHVRQRRMDIRDDCVKSPDSGIIWAETPKKRRGEALVHNLIVASVLVLCAVTLRSGALPSLNDAADVILTAATDDSLLDDQLGRLSFVSALFPEAVLVFGESSGDVLAHPVSGGVVVHAWSEAEPYTSWRGSSDKVTSASAGEVIGVYHGNGDERLVQVMGNDGLACLYGNLAQVDVAVGDAVQAGDEIGTLITGADAVFEVRRDGMSIDPALYLGHS